jgi:hypothetical protein
LLVFISKKSHRSETQEAVRCRGLYAILTKGKSFELQEIINYRDVHSKYIEEWKKKAISVKSVYVTHFAVKPPCSMIRIISLVLKLEFWTPDPNSWDAT